MTAPRPGASDEGTPVETVLEAVHDAGEKVAVVAHDAGEKALETAGAFT